MTKPALLDISDVRKDYSVRLPGQGWRTRTFSAISGVTFSLGHAETICIVGESGCGKSTLARVLANLTPLSGGTVRLEGSDIGQLRGAALKEVRRKIQMVFQDPYSSLNPRLTVGQIIAEPLENFTSMNRQERRDRCAETLEKVGLSIADLDRLPGQMSGGQRQRIGIARAIVAKPEIIIADEAVSALDVSVKSQILNLMLDLQDQMGLSIIFITHDIGLIQSIADRIVVMYLGRVVEMGAPARLLSRPRHPYTRMLMAAIPRADPRARFNFDSRVSEVPSVLDPPTGCVFRTRCPHATQRCLGVPPFVTDQFGDLSACHYADAIDMTSRLQNVG